MRESTAMTLRVSVMLICLVGIPLIALFGTSLPQMCVAMVERFTGSEGDAAGTQQEAEQAERNEYEAAPLYSGGMGATPLQGAAAPPPVQLTETAPAPNGFLPNPAATPGNQPDPCAAWPASTATIPAGYAATPTASPNSGIAQMTPVAPGPAYAGPPPTGLQPPRSVLPHIMPTAPPEMNRPSGMPPQPMMIPSAVPASGGAFTQIEQQLRARGAMYWRLESWGTEGRLYRFSCRMSDSATPQLARHVEATAESPLEAMQKVLADVESRQPGR